MALKWSFHQTFHPTLSSVGTAGEKALSLQGSHICARLIIIVKQQSRLSIYCPGLIFNVSCKANP